MFDGTVSFGGIVSVGVVSSGLSMTGGSFSSQQIIAVRKRAADNILMNLLIVVNYHICCVENKVSVWVVYNESKCVLTALKTIL